MSSIASTPPRAEQGADHQAPAAAHADSERDVDDTSASPIVEASRDASASRPGRAGEQRFPKACRVLSRREYLRIQGQGQRIHSRHLVFQFLPGEGPESRLGITVSKKVGNAVARNRIKRWIRDAFRRHPELRPGVATGVAGRAFDLVITAKRDVDGFDWQGLHDQIVYVLGRYLAERGARGGKRARHPAGAAPAGGSGAVRPRTDARRPR